MEGDQRKHHRYTKRRERQQCRDTPDGSRDEMDSSPNRNVKEKPRIKPRRRRNRSNSHDEDIIDGFAILSFKTLDDLNAKFSLKQKTLELNNQKNDIVKKLHKKKKSKKNCRPLSPITNRLSDSSAIHSPFSDRTEEFSDCHQKTASRDEDLSDASSNSSSGRGYICDSESGDDRASDASLDLFSTVNHNRECPAPSTTTSSSSLCSTPVVPSVLSSTDSVVTQSIVSTTSAYTTATITSPTSSTTTTTSNIAITKTTVSSVIANGPLTTSKEKKPSSPIRTKPVKTRSPQPPLSRSFTRPSSNTPSLKEQRKYSLSPVQTGRREIQDIRSDQDFPLPASFGFSKPWTSGNSSHHHHPFNPVSRSPALPQFPLHSNPPNHGSPFSNLPPSPLHQLQTPGPQSMFAAPLPPGAGNGSLTSPHNLGASGLSSNASSESMSIASQEILREELNRRFLAAQERSPMPVLGSQSPYVRTDIHQHQHMHQHSHQHTHQHMFTLPSFAGSLVPSPAPHLFDKIPKPFESSFYRATPGLVGYPVVPPLVPAAGTLNSGVPGAFQPKKVTGSLHPSQIMLPSLREQDKLHQNPAAASLPHHKKSGKWCTMHVKIAWKIHQHQQETEGSKGPDSKSMDPLQQSSRSLGGGGGSLHRPTDLSAASPLLGMGSFPRPSPYSISSHEGFGGLGKGGSPFGSGSRDVPRIPGITSPLEWNRLHRNSPLFSGSSWSKPDERDLEKEKEKEKEREVLMGLDRRRDEREREKRTMEKDHRGSVELHQGREKERQFMNDPRHSHTNSRSRSRSPLVSSRVGSAKSDASYDRYREDKDVIKIKEEKLEDNEQLMLDKDKDKLRHDFLYGPLGASNQMSANLMERSRLLGGPSPFPIGADRIPTHGSMWNSHDKNMLDFNYHRLQLQQDMEQERERMLRRLQQPNLAHFDAERLRKEDLLLQEERLRREYLERLPMYDRDRYEREKLAYESSRMSHPRNLEHFRPGNFPRTVSPLVNSAGVKMGSPAMLQGVPPPLIPSSSTSRSHSNSPLVGKLKPNNSSDMDKRDTYSTSNADGSNR